MPSAARTRGRRTRCTRGPGSGWRGTAPRTLHTAPALLPGDDPYLLFVNRTFVHKPGRPSASLQVRLSVASMNGISTASLHHATLSVGVGLIPDPGSHPGAYNYSTSQDIVVELMDARGAVLGGDRVVVFEFAPEEAGFVAPALYITSPVLAVPWFNATAAAEAVEAIAARNASERPLRLGEDGARQAGNVSVHAAKPREARGASHLEM